MRGVPFLWMPRGIRLWKLGFGPDGRALACTVKALAQASSGAIAVRKRQGSSTHISYSLSVHQCSIALHACRSSRKSDFLIVVAADICFCCGRCRISSRLAACERGPDTGEAGIQTHQSDPAKIQDVWLKVARGVVKVPPEPYTQLDMIFGFTGLWTG